LLKKKLRIQKKTSTEGCFAEGCKAALLVVSFKRRVKKKDQEDFNRKKKSFAHKNQLFFMRRKENKLRILLAKPNVWYPKRKENNYVEGILPLQGIHSCIPSKTNA